MLTLAFGFGGPWDVAIVAGVVLLLFGGSKLGGFGKNLGEGIKEFKRATHDEEPAPPVVAPPVVPPAAPVVTASAAEEK